MMIGDSIVTRTGSIASLKQVMYVDLLDRMAKANSVITFILVKKAKIIITVIIAV